MRDKVLAIMKELFDNVDVENETALIDDELIDSFGVIQLASALMEEFDIYIDADDIEPENFNSIDAITELVESKAGA